MREPRFSSDEFARLLPSAGVEQGTQTGKSSPKRSAGDGLSADELREWLELFGGGDEDPGRKRPKR